MKKILKNIFLNNFKSIFYMLQNSNSKYLEIETIGFKIKKNCNLGKKETLILSRPDQIITPNLMKKGEWDYFIVKFLKKYLKKNKTKYSFIDIGANIGLITRQIITNKINFNNYHCIEPESKNFKLLKKNLGNLDKKNIYFHNFALSPNKSSFSKIFLNNENFGDFSLLYSKKSNKFQKIKSVRPNKFFNKIINQYKIRNIIYKSDIQGMDEIVALSLNEKIIQKIKVMFLEISNINFLNNNLDKFSQLINKFAVKEDEKGNRISSKLILKKIKNNETFNLILVKN